MPEHHPPQILEPRYCIVCKRSGLISFLAHQSKPDMRLRNHIDIISTVADSCCNFFVCVILHERNNFSFLSWR